MAGFRAWANDLRPETRKRVQRTGNRFVCGVCLITALFVTMMIVRVALAWWGGRL